MLWVLTSLIAATADGGEIRMGSFTNAKSGWEGWALDGSELSETRGMLDGATEASEGFTVSITLFDGPLAATDLTDVDVFFVNWVRDGNLAPAELAMLDSWVTSGGVLWLTCDDVDHDEVCSHLGYDLDPQSNVPPLVPTPAGAAHPLFAGPFGTVSSFEGWGQLGRWTSIPAGAVALARDQQGIDVVAIENRGAGRVYAFGDIDLFSGYTLLGGGFSGTPNGRLFGNLLAHIDDFDPEPGDTGDTGDTGDSGDTGISDTADTAEPPDTALDTGTPFDGTQSAGVLQVFAGGGCRCRADAPGRAPWLAAPLALMVLRRRRS